MHGWLVVFCTMLYQYMWYEGLMNSFWLMNFSFLAIVLTLSNKHLENQKLERFVPNLHSSHTIISHVWFLVSSLKWNYSDGENDRMSVSIPSGASVAPVVDQQFWHKKSYVPWHLSWYTFRTIKNCYFHNCWV